MLIDIGRGAQVESKDVVYVIDEFSDDRDAQYPLYAWDVSKARCGLLLRQGAVVPVFITIPTLRMRLQLAEQEEARRGAMHVIQMGGVELAPPPMRPNPMPVVHKPARKKPAAKKPPVEPTESVAAPHE